MTFEEKKFGNQDLTTMNTEQQATVIIPCFNVEAYIIDCLDSVELQCESVYHTFIVDNNCTDNTIAMVREWQEAHPAFSLTIAKQTTPGAPAARNHPLSLVKTKWVQFLDADDVLLANKISDQIKRFPDADVICAGGIHVAIDGTERQSIPEPNIPLALMKGQAGITSSNLFSTTSVQTVQGWAESLKSSQEYDLMFRLWQSGGAFSVDILPRALIRERPSGQISQNDPNTRWNTFISLRMKMLEALKERNLSEVEIGIVLQAIFDKVRILFRYDHQSAAVFFEELQKKGFVLEASTACSHNYVRLSRILGVIRTEKLIDFLETVRLKSY